MKKILLTIIMAGCFALYSADSLQVVWGMVDHNGLEFTNEKLANVTFKAWISNYSLDYLSNVITESDAGNSIELFADLRGACLIDFSNFTDWVWSVGDQLNISIKDCSADFKEESFYGAEAIWDIPVDANGVNYLGFSEFLGYGGFPINSWIVFPVITDVYIGCVDNIGGKFDFSAYPYDNVSFRCWITGREDDVIDQNSSGSRFKNYSSTSAIKIYRYNFQTYWESGDTLNVSIKQWIPGQGYYFGEKQFIFSTTHGFSHYGPYDIKFGYGDDGGGDPVMADTWIEDSSLEEFLPVQTALFQNYPNPFNPVTQIKFALAKTADVKLSVYNISGQLVSQLAGGTMNAGVHAVDFDGSRLNSGIYYYTLEVDGNKITKKMVLTK